MQSEILASNIDTITITAITKVNFHHFHFYYTLFTFLFKMKKQLMPNAKTDQANQKNSVSGIKSFFKSAPKDFVVVENTETSKSNEGAKTFYVDILKEKLRSKTYYFFIYLLIDYFYNLE